MYLTNNTLLQGGKYKIVGHISSGGFGNTYEGVHTMMDTRVAIKEFFPKMFCNRDENTSHITVATQSNKELVDKLRKKFIEEAKAIFKMNHPNIVKVHDIFEENGTAYYVMDYIDGKSLGDIVKQRGPLPEAEAVGYIRQVADALKYVHSLNRLHLDIKPGNVMVDKNNKAILIDFGASKHYDDESGENTSTLMGVNTKGYAPIEQSAQSFTKFSPATDIYALGATLYKLLTGITPPDANLLMAREEMLEPMPACISTVTRNAVLNAIALIRADRPQNVDAFLSLLNAMKSRGIDEEVTVCDEEVKMKVKKAQSSLRIMHYFISFALLACLIPLFVIFDQYTPFLLLSDATIIIETIMLIVFYKLLRKRIYLFSSLIFVLLFLFCCALPECSQNDNASGWLIIVTLVTISTTLINIMIVRNLNSKRGYVKS